MPRLDFLAGAVLPLALSLLATPAFAVSPGVAPAAAAAQRGDVLATVKALRKSDPAKALAIGEPVWAAATDKNAVVELGLELGDAAVAARNEAKAVEIGSALREQHAIVLQRRAD